MERENKFDEEMMFKDMVKEEIHDEKMRKRAQDDFQNYKLGAQYEKMDVENKINYITTLADRLETKMQDEEKRLEQILQKDDEMLELIDINESEIKKLE